MTLFAKRWDGMVLMTCVALFVVAIGSSSQAEKIPPQSVADIHKLGIFSQLGDEAEIKKIGYTVFGNRLTELNIAGWQLNELFTSEATLALSTHFSVKVAPFGTSVLKDTKKDIFHSFFGPGESPFIAMPESELDAYLVFLPTMEMLPYPSNQSIKGLGMLHQLGAGSDIPGTQPRQFDGTLFADNRPSSAIVYAIYTAYLVDAKSGRVMAIQRGEVPTRYHQTLAQMLIHGTPAAPIRYPHPHEYVPDGIWSDTAEMLTEAQKQLLRDKLISLIKNSVSYSLDQMGLTQEAARAAVVGDTDAVTRPEAAPASRTLPPH